MEIELLHGVLASLGSQLAASRSGDLFTEAIESRFTCKTKLRSLKLKHSHSRFTLQVDKWLVMKLLK